MEMVSTNAGVRNTRQRDAPSVIAAAAVTKPGHGMLPITQNPATCSTEDPSAMPKHSTGRCRGERFLRLRAMPSILKLPIIAT